MHLGLTGRVEVACWNAPLLPVAEVTLRTRGVATVWLLRGRVVWGWEREEGEQSERIG